MSTDEMLDAMATVMFYATCWHARAKGSTTFFVGRTPREAMQHALGLVDLRAQADAPNADLF